MCVDENGKWRDEDNDLLFYRIPPVTSSALATSICILTQSNHHYYHREIRYWLLFTRWFFWKEIEPLAFTHLCSKFFEFLALPVGILDLVELLKPIPGNPNFYKVGYSEKKQNIFQTNLFYSIAIQYLTWYIGRLLKKWKSCIGKHPNDSVHQ